MIEIRPMTEEDLDQVTALEGQCFSEPWSRQSFLDTMDQDYALYLCALEGGQVAGYCGFLQSFDEAEIVNVAVRPDRQRTGIGRRMLTALMEAGKKRGIQSFTLEVRCSNAGAIHLYESLGFESAGIRPGFYDLPREDALIMWTK